MVNGIDCLISLSDISLFSSVQFSSVTQSCPTLCDPMNHSTPGLPVHHKLPEFTQTHIHRVSDAIQPSHPLSSSFPPAFNLFQHQGQFYASGGQSIGVSALPSAVILETKKKKSVTVSIASQSICQK